MYIIYVHIGVTQKQKNGYRKRQVITTIKSNAKRAQKSVFLKKCIFITTLKSIVILVIYIIILLYKLVDLYHGGYYHVQYYS